MCGIAGKVWFDAERPADVDAVRAMTDALAHRGPDGQGLHVDGAVALGHRRLAIVDLSERGAQPMLDREAGLVLVANGEIYNHSELRAELAHDGHSFRSDCDVEVILAAYRRWYTDEGARFVDRLDGMYAFALWDGRARRLVLARDRTGQKPLVYAHTPTGLSFASELAALRHDPDLDRTPDDRALADYLAFRCVPHPRTAWLGARKLPPAHVAVLEDGQLTLTRTWALAAGPEGGSAPSLDEAAEEVDARLSEAVRKRLMADVPVGALLSGGLDSAGVVAHMAAHGADISTYTIGFDERAWDETSEARAVARAFGTRHHEELVRPDALATLDAVLAHYGEPFADTSALPCFLVSKLAAQHVKVVLTGDGGDEAFAGYDRHRALLLAERLASPAAAPVRAGLRVAHGVLSLAGAGGQRSAGQRLGRLLEALDRPPRARNHAWRLVAAPERLAALLSEEGRRRFGVSSHYGPDLPGPLPLNEALLLDLERYLPDDLLVKIDIASMAYGLEARAPFLDRALLEYASGLPAGLKRRGRVGKLVLRRSLARRLPADLADGPKRGFGVPIDAWLRAGPLHDHAREVLLGPGSRRRGLLDHDAVERLLAAHSRREVAAHDLLFTLLVLERWFAEAA